MSEVVLYDYWRSSASYRVRIALNLAGISFRSVNVDLLKKDHQSAEHLARNPQGFVPALAIDGLLLTQSLAIIEYIAETRNISFLPPHAADRAKLRSIAYAIAMDIHPVCNLSVAAYVMEITGKGDQARNAWMKKFISKGLASVESMLQSTKGQLCFGDEPTMADMCLVPQAYNAIRWGVDMSDLTRVNAITKNLELHPAFVAAHPDCANQN